MMDKELLLKQRLAEEDVPIDGVGSVRVRGLSRQDLIDLRDDDDTPGAFERAMLATAMVDPELTVDEVGVWQRSATPGEIDEVMKVVNRLSGLGKEAAKDAYKEFESDPDAEFRALPGAAAGDDGDSAPGGDAEL